jgi:hypothetical protein
VSASLGYYWRLIRAQHGHAATSAGRASSLGFFGARMPVALTMAPKRMARVQCHVHLHRSHDPLGELRKSQVRNTTICRGASQGAHVDRSRWFPGPEKQRSRLSAISRSLTPPCLAIFINPLYPGQSKDAYPLTCEPSL